MTWILGLADHLLGRMNATMRFVMTGAIGQYAGVRTAVWAAAAGLASTWVPLMFSPPRRMRSPAGHD